LGSENGDSAVETGGCLKFRHRRAQGS